MSPIDVWACTSTASSLGSGTLRRVEVVLHACRTSCRDPARPATPSRTPTSTLPNALWATTAPRATSPRRTSPLAVFATTPAWARSIAILPFAAFTRTSPATSPIHVSPLEFLTTARPSTLAIAHGAGAGGDLGRADDPVHGDVAGAGLELHRTGRLRARMSPTPVSEAALAEATRAAERPHAGLTREAGAGRQVDPHVDRLGPPRGPNGLHCRQPFGARTRSRPFAYSTRVCSAAATSARFDGSLGRTSTRCRRDRSRRSGRRRRRAPR